MASFDHTHGLPVVTRDGARQVGTVNGLVVDVDGPRIRSLDLGAGVRQRYVDYGHVNVGDDAVVVDSTDHLRAAEDDGEQRVADGALHLVGKRVLDDGGDAHGDVTDVSFEADDGVLTEIETTTGTIPARDLVGVGSYAVVVRSEEE